MDKVELTPEAEKEQLETKVLGKVVYTITDKEGEETTTRDRSEAKEAAASGLSVKVNGVPIFDKDIWQNTLTGLGTFVVDVIPNPVKAAETNGNTEVTTTAARGGFIRGAGTGTSDSIRAWLSNGEYVMDAFTTRLFGSDFFSGLQALARSGRGKQSAMIPKFATGGPVSVPSGGGQGGSILSQVLSSMSGPALAPVNLSIGGETFQVQADKDNIDSLTTHVRRQAMKFGKRRR